MPIAKSPALLKTEALAQVGGFLSNLPAAIARADKALTDGVPANAQSGAPALSAEEIAAVVGPEIVAFVKASAAAAPQS